GLEVFVLTRLRVNLVDDFKGSLQGLRLQCQLPALLRAGFYLLRRDHPLPTERGDLGGLAPQPCALVDRGQLIRAVPEAKRVSLAVDGDDRRGDRPEHTRGDSRPGEVSGGTPRSGPRPGRDVHPLVREAAELRDDRLNAFLDGRVVVGKDS